ncbi:hypothetical protein L495_1736 [Bordetella bronchiseptica CARE970018BB]|nr:hypothetical protein L489_5589 [Bordetella bronchiseptica 00-P-2730]KDB80880.1 hypothetical protein L495_1736 [Bordetella bronchiseptica CARE970018BB]KDB91131.1 hypothetical protein AZ18_3714 [Bordetella bronchiseptica D993]
MEQPYRRLRGGGMTYREKDIAYENGRVWVLKKSDSYTVFVSGVTHSTSDSTYELSDAESGIAKARADYLARKLNPAGGLV